MKKAIIGAFLILVIVFGALFTREYLRVRPMLSVVSARGRIAIARRLEAEIENKGPFTRAHGEELSDDQVTRFLAIEERVDAAVAADYAAFQSHATHLDGMRAQGLPVTALDVLRGFAPLSGRFLKARQAQVSALNDARFSKDEYDWVKAHVYAAAGRDLTHLSLQSIVEDPDLTIRVRIVQEHLLDSTPDINRRLVASHLSKIERWRALAFFDL